MPNVTWEAVWNVLKWVLLVLVAGFVGQFGKALAMRLIERRKQSGADTEPPPRPLSEEAELERVRRAAEAKIEKKRAKAEVKRAKKADDKPSS